MNSIPDKQHFSWEQKEKAWCYSALNIMEFKRLMGVFHLYILQFEMLIFEIFEP